MDSNVIVSVIVPVYNVEKYLIKCLESLVNQTMNNIEIIIVNDGSTDNSQLIIDNYMVTYPDKVCSYIKGNGGLGEARNYGIERARGQYIAFVDSDDWVDPNMIELMYNATKLGHDIVLCDFMVVNDGMEVGKVAKGFRGDKFNHKEVMINSINPATACNKLYAKKMFDIITFPSYWYEDVGTIPILLSYAASIGYVELPLYYYRNRKGSITNSFDERTLGIIKAWDRVIRYVHNKYKDEAVMAVCKSISAFLDFKPEFADEYLEYINENNDLIRSNAYFLKAVDNKFIYNMFDINLIPKKIHYFWFGGGEKSELIKQCINSWKKYAENYEIIEWNESNCDIKINSYVMEAYEAKKWAFVADYFRIMILFEQGGIYLDTDMELKNSIDCLRISDAFFAFETIDAVHAGIIGAVRNHSLIKHWLDSYNNDHFKNSDGTYNTSNTIVIRLTNILIDHYGIKMNGQYQVLPDNIKIYSPNVLTIDVYDGKNVAVHHYDASWWDVKEEMSYKYTVLKDYFLANESRSHNSIKNLYRKLKRTADNEKSARAKLLRVVLDMLLRFYKKYKR